MTWFRNKLPLPLWLVVLMFILGIVAGLGIGIWFSIEKSDIKSEIRRWEQARAKAVKNTDWKRKASGDKQAPLAADLTGPEAATSKTEAAPGKTSKLGDPKDEHLLTNMVNGPVKRALRGAIKRIWPIVRTCFALTGKNYSDHSGEIVMRFEFESIGGMATVTGANTLGEEAGDKDVQTCVLKKITELLIDFPVEDGQYAVLHRFLFKKTSQGEDTPKGKEK